MKTRNITVTLNLPESVAKILDFHEVMLQVPPSEYIKKLILRNMSPRLAKHEQIALNHRLYDNREAALIKKRLELKNLGEAWRGGQ